MHYTVDIIIKGQIESKQLYEELRCYEPCVTDIITETYVSANVDLTMPDIENIIAICKKYGDCDIEVRNVKPA